MRPEFTDTGYYRMLASLEKHYRFEPVRSMFMPQENACYLRHDVDLHLDIEEMAQRDAHFGIVSTFYILLSGQYNVCAPENVKRLKNIVALGHDIGLHYDLRAYPEDAFPYLAFEVGILERIVGVRVLSVTMHEPSAQADTLLNIACYINPMAHDIPYISDSCKRWRDDRIVDAMEGRGPSRLHLNVHPELWLDDRDWDELKKGVSHGHVSAGGRVS
jgi:hypothetical protein